MAQRVQLATAMVHEPDLLVLDEPFAGLDPTAVEFLIGLLVVGSPAAMIVPEIIDGDDERYEIVVAGPPDQLSGTPAAPTPGRRRGGPRSPSR